MSRRTARDDPIPDTRLITFIKEQNKEGITGELEQLKTWLYQKGSESYLYMTFSLGSFYTHLMKELGKSGINLQDIFQNPIEEFKKWQPAVHWSPASKT